MIHAEAVTKRYRTGAVWLEVLKGVTLTVPQGEFVAITGPSGAGKSTLLHVLAGLDRPTSGRVLWGQQSLAKMPDAQLAKLRNDAVGFVFQFYHLLPELTAVGNVMLPGLIHRKHPGRQLKSRAMELLEQVGLRDRVAHKPSQLSGGELQRVAIARALINAPRALFCDEPTGNLDSQTGQHVADLLMAMRRHAGASLILVTHEQSLAALADRWLVLTDGWIVSDTKTSEKSREQAGRVRSR